MIRVCRNRIVSILRVAVTVGVCAATASHADEALYAEAPPADAVFIRAFTGDAAAQDTGVLPASLVARIAAHGETYTALGASDFGFAEPGKFYAVLSDDTGGFRLVAEPDRADRSKVHLVLLNATSQKLHVTAPELGMEVVKATDPLSAASRAVNPISVVLAVENADTGAVLETLDLRLRRGQNVTLLAAPDGVKVIEDAFGPVISDN